MMNGRYWITVVLSLWIAVILNNSLAHHLAILKGRPDFVLIVGLCLALISRPAAAAWIGLIGGILHAGVAGANLAHYATSRILACFGLSLARDTTFESGPVFAGVACLVGTIIAEAIFMFFAAPPNIGGFLQATIGTAIYNGVFAMPVFAVLRRLALPDKVDL